MSNRKRRTSSLSSLSLRILSKYGTLYRPGKFLVNRLCTDSTLRIFVSLFMCLWYHYIVNNYYHNFRYLPDTTKRETMKYSPKIYGTTDNVFYVFYLLNDFNMQ